MHEVLVNRLGGLSLPRKSVVGLTDRPDMTLDVYRGRKTTMPKKKKWTTFVLDKSEGFTQAGVERLNDSIRTYVLAILGAQAQTQSNILKIGTGFDAQKQFLADIEDGLPRPLTSPVASLGIRKHCNMHPHPRTSCSGLGRATWHSIRVISRGTTTRSR